MSWIAVARPTFRRFFFYPLGGVRMGTWGALIGIAFAASAALLPSISLFPNGLVEDDGYFYSQIAYNIAQSRMSSFDGVTTTSGYHLLWCGILALSSSMLSLITASKAVSIFVHLAIYLSFVLFAARVATDRLWLALGLAALILTSSMMMEVGLLAFLLAILFRRFLTDDEWHNSPDVLLAAFAVPITRIDSTVIVAVMLMYLFVRQRRSATVLATAALAGVVVHLAVMGTAFGHLTSVSSYLKVTTAHGLAAPWDSIRDNVFRGFGQQYRFLLLLLLLTLSLVSIVRAKTRAIAWRRVAVVAAVMAFFLPLLVTLDVRGWYFVPPFLGLFMVADAATRDEGAPCLVRRALSAFCALVLLMQIAGRISYALNYKNDQANSADLIAHAQALVPPSGRIYQTDGSGFFGFFLGRTVINGDGLVNSYDYATRLINGALSSYLEEMNICFILTNWADGGDGDYPIIDIAGLRVERNEAVLLYKAKLPVKYQFAHFKLYALKRSDCAGSIATIERSDIE
jgi:hypothetical protein